MQRTLHQYHGRFRLPPNIHVSRSHLAATALQSPILRTGSSRVHGLGQIRCTSTSVTPSDEKERSISEVCRHNARRKSNGIHSQYASIKTFEDLQLQSQVDQEPEQKSILLVDHENFKHDHQLWLELLQFQERLCGHVGIQRIWRGMRRRHVDVPTEGLIADHLWTTFMAAAASDHTFREQVWVYAKQRADDTNDRWSYFFPAFLGPLLEKQPESAVTWYARLQRHKFTNLVSLKDLVHPATSSPSALKAFRKIYERHGKSRLYDDLIPLLCNVGRRREALGWHAILVGHGDLPTRVNPRELLGNAVDLQGGHSRWDTTFDARKDGTKLPQIMTVDGASSHADDEQLPRALTLDKSFPTQRKPLSDHLAARAFATRAFSLSLIISGLLNFGLLRLGALAMRELAVRCSTVQELAQHLQRLEEADVTIDDKVFTVVVRKTAYDQNQQMMDAILENDQHPDVYDDWDLQQRLLIQYVAQLNWTQVRRTLLVLSIFHHRPPQEAYNIVLREFMKNQKWHMVDAVVRDMLSQNVKITPITIRHSYFTLLRPRRKGRQPVQSINPHSIDDVSFLTRMWQRILRHGGKIPITAWKQILIFYGKEGRIRELENLCLTIVNLYSHYSRPTSGRMAFHRGRNYVTLQRLGVKRQGQLPVSRSVSSLLALLFNARMQRAIVEWGFKTLGKPMWRQNRTSPFDQNSTATENVPSDWDRGLRLLRALRRRGLVLYIPSIYASCRTRFKILFGPGVSNKPENRLAVENNSHKLEHMITQANQILGQGIVPFTARGSENQKGLPQVNFKQRNARRRLAPICSE